MTTVDSRMTPAANSTASAQPPTRIPPFVRKLLRSQQFGLVIVIVLLVIALLACSRARTSTA